MLTRLVLAAFVVLALGCAGSTEPACVDNVPTCPAGYAPACTAPTWEWAPDPETGACRPFGAIAASCVDGELACGTGDLRCIPPAYDVREDCEAPEGVWIW